jgi:hypothetical protein
MTEYYVSNSGNNGNTGKEIENPFLTINHGLSILQEGDILTLRHGTYLEQVSISSKKNIAIRSYTGEHACIDGSLEDFQILNSNQWELASLTDPGAHSEEYISTQTFSNAPNNPVNRGAFLDVHPYTRLITYMNLNDLRSANETFEQIMIEDSDPRDGPELVVEECGKHPGPECGYTLDNKGYKPVSYRYPWVYMGPGLWFDRQTQRVHARFSHTHNNVPGVVDYTGETDPNRVRLAISSKLMKTVSIVKCENVRLDDLSIRFGGDETMILANCKNVVFDHVCFLCARTGVNLAGNAVGPVKDTVFQHCEFDGGLPTWYFRTDRKARYFFVENGKVFENRPGGGTLDLLLFGNLTNIGTKIHHCEFHDAHDVYLFGTGVEFHHNWIHNLNDEGLFLDAGAPVETQHFEMKIYQNVITKTLSAISFAGNHSKGNWYIYRNLIDLRSPTAGFRPKKAGDKKVWRYGHLIKMAEPDGPRDFFQNTFLVYAQHERTSYRHYAYTQDNQLRRTFNNIFIAINPDSNFDRPITFIPSPSFPGPTDGNNYCRIGLATNHLLLYDPYNFIGDPACPTLDPDDKKKSHCGGGKFLNLDALRGNAADGIEPSLLFIQSKSQYSPGYEANSREEDPQFHQFDPNGIPQSTDDLRLKSTSPLRGKGVTLPDDIRFKDPFAPPEPDTKPDIGCFPFGSGPLEVGVDGRKSFPSV